MRDLALLAIIAGLIPVIMRHPWIGVLVGAWISLMNPHRYAFGFANNFPFAFIVALATVASLVFGKQKIEFPRHGVLVMIILLMVWFSITLLFALEPDAAFAQWVNVMKVFLLVLLSGGASALRTRQPQTLYCGILLIGSWAATVS